MIGLRREIVNRTIFLFIEHNDLSVLHSFTHKVYASFLMKIISIIYS